MKAKVTSIQHPNDHINARINVEVKGREYGLYITHRNWNLFDLLKVGQEIEVQRQGNNPFLVPI